MTLEPLNPCGGGVVSVRGAMCSIFHATRWIIIWEFVWISRRLNIGIKTKKNNIIVHLCNFLYGAYTRRSWSNLLDIVPYRKSSSVRCFLPTWVCKNEESSQPVTTSQLSGKNASFEIGKVLNQKKKPVSSYFSLKKKQIFLHHGFSSPSPFRNRQSNAAENVYVTDAGGHIMLYQIRYDAGVGVTASNLDVSKDGWNRLVVVSMKEGR